MSPPGRPFTDQVTFVVEVPPSWAWNCTVRVTVTEAVAGVTVTAPRTTKVVADVALPSGAVTVIGPVAAPFGTVVTMRVGAAAVTAAAAPVNVTEFCDGVALKPVPKIWTWVPTLPLLGVTSVMRTGPGCWLASKRSTRTKLPAASYV